MTTLPIDRIRADGGTQPRSEIAFAVVEEYAAAMADGCAFPPVVVYYDGTDYWLADGFHRREARKVVGFTDVEADVRQGTRRDAVLHSVGANADHGLRRTNEDKRRAVRKLLEDIQPRCKDAGRHVCHDQHWTEWCWSTWVDREIARRCGVSDRMVNGMRPRDTAKNSQYDRTFVHPKTGQPTQMNTARIGSNPAPRPAADRPVFDNTAAGKSEPAWTPADIYDPEPEAPKRQPTEREVFGGNTEISVTLFKVRDLLRDMPDPAIAARDYPTGHYQSLTTEDVRAMAEWLSAFADLWAADETRRVAFVARRIERAKEHINAAQ